MSSSKYNKVTSKENHENNNLKKHCSKFTSETLIWSQCLFCKLWKMFDCNTCLKFKNIQYIQRQNRMLKTRLTKVKSIENEEIIMTVKRAKIKIATVIIKIIIMMIMRIKIDNQIKI